MVVRLLTIGLVALVVMLPISEALAAEEKAPPKRRVGWVERVYLPEIDAGVKAKLDTGARTTAIHAEIIDIRDPNPPAADEEILGEEGDEKAARANGNGAEAKKPKRRKKRSTIVFAVLDDEDQSKIMEREIVRWVRIKKKTGEGYLRRPVVKMDFCLAGQRISAEVNLADRGHFLYPLLIGRNLLAQANLVVDSAETFRIRHRCPDPEEDAADKH